jgi:16S rRNA (adenine1518-N6/adenine1519-N6)-dimethyltransferase
MKISENSIGAMNLTSIADIHRMLDLLKLHPQKAMGQNFLVDANILGIILKSANLAPQDEALEIGAGFGSLTEALAKQVRRVVTIEKDSRLAEFLRIRFQPLANVELIVADALRLDLRKYWSAGINKMVANLPYSVGSALLMDIFKSERQPETIVVTLQVEVGRRLAAKPNEKDYGLLSIWSQLSFDTEICRVISPNCFYPRPEVQSAVLRLTRRKQNPAELVNRDFFFALTKCAFGQRRKQLQTILSHAPPQFRRPGPELQKIFQEMQMDPRIRPEAISAAEWVRLANLLCPR